MVWEGVEEGEEGEEENAEGCPRRGEGGEGGERTTIPLLSSACVCVAATFAGLVRLETVSLRGLGLTGTIRAALFALTTLKSRSVRQPPRGEIHAFLRGSRRWRRCARGGNRLRGPRPGVSADV